ncbi:hypothetical protein GECvBMG_gp201 [Salmonella phage GEC_vB_MG]|nr:hypothetical protein GECvBMG_gp201 [Salmonella phage GEC_vB_MG]
MTFITSRHYNTKPLRVVFATENNVQIDQRGFVNPLYLDTITRGRSTIVDRCYRGECDNFIV